MRQRAHALSYGSSPQARGTRRLGGIDRVHARFIPAGAGNTQRCGGGCHQQTVHPRRRGEHLSTGRASMTNKGSSPQARGTPGRRPHRRHHRRFIPAGAGNTSWTVHTSRGPSVHPRRRGEHIEQDLRQAAVDGSSPQARGTRQRASRRQVTKRFIPAGAGNTPRGCPPAQCGPVHPRRRGEHLERSAIGLRIAGSSPQARGTQRGADLKGADLRFIPAGAGNTPPPDIRGH